MGMVRFILGRAGSGKTRHCFGQIEAMVRADALGPPIFLLVPRQATFQAERQLVARLGAFSRVRVLSLDGLATLILEECGTVGIPQVTAVGRRLVIGHLLRRHANSLRFYGSSAARPGLAAEIDSTFGELERCGADAASLQQARDALASGDEALAAKLDDLALLLDRYTAHITRARLDPRQRMEKVLKEVVQCPLLRDSHVFVDDFYGFGAQEQKLLVGVAHAAVRTEIALLMDPDAPLVREPHLLPQDMALFHRTERAFRSLHLALLQRQVPIEPPLLLREIHRFESPALVAMERGLFNPAAPAFFAGGAIERFTAPDARAEVDAVARRIRAALAAGLRLRDVAVLVRDPDAYHTLIDASFAEHDLPFFVDRRRTAAHHPLLQFIRAAILIARHHWPHEMAMVLVKSGLAGVSDEEADLLENYVLHHRIRGPAWEQKEAWAYHRRLTRRGGDDDARPVADADPSERLDRVRRCVAEKLAPLLHAIRAATAARPATVSDLIHALLNTLESFNIRQTLAQWMQQATAANQLEQRAEHERVWAELIALLEQMFELLRDEPVSADDFLGMLDAGLEGFDLAITPPRIDQVLVGQVDRTRTPAVKLMLVLGLGEGSFPQLSRPDCVLSDAERRRLGTYKLELDPDTQRRLLDERLLAYLAFTRPSQRLIVSRPLADEHGRPSNPSAYWIELGRLCPDAEAQQEPRADGLSAGGDGSSAGAIGTPRQLVTALMQWARRRSKSEDEPHSPPAADSATPWPALYQWLATSSHCSDAMDTMRRRAWNALAYTNEARLSHRWAAALFASPLAATAGELETFAACPFRHFARFGLQLEPRESSDVTGLDLSNAYHYVLENLVTAVLRKRQDWCEAPPAMLAELIHRHAAEIGKQLRGELMLSTARNRYLLHHIESTLEQAVASQCAMHSRGRYRPAFAGVRFGPGERLDAYTVQTPHGNQVQLHGRIDRVDLNAEDDTFTVSDYRLHGQALSLEQVHHGLSLQLLTYLLVLSASGEQLAGRPIAPAAAFLLGVLRPTKSVEHPDDAPAPDDPDFHLRQKPRGIIHRRAIVSLDSELQTGYSSVLSVMITKEGAIGRRNQSDAAESAEFAALLKWVQKRIGELTDQIVSGDIRVWPYWLGGRTPCPTCDFRSVCRFEPSINGYHHLQRLKREQVLEQCCAGGGGEREPG